MSSAQTIFNFSVLDLDGKEVGLDQYIGKVFLIANTASLDNKNHELNDLETLYKKFKDKGLEVLAFPCRQFLKKEHKDSEKIRKAYQKSEVSFKVFSLIKVNGDRAHPLFKWLKRQAKGPRGAMIDWNYTKFFVKEDGSTVVRFTSTDKLSKICKTIEENLPTKEIDPESINQDQSQEQAQVEIEIVDEQPKEPVDDNEQSNDLNTEK